MAEDDRVKQVVSVLKDALASIESVSTSTDHSSGSSTARQGTSRLPIRRPTSTVCGSLGIGELVDLVITLGL